MSAFDGWSHADLAHKCTRLAAQLAECEECLGVASARADHAEAKAESRLMALRDEVERRHPAEVERLTRERDTERSGRVTAEFERELLRGALLEAREVAEGLRDRVAHFGAVGPLPWEPKPSEGQP